MCLEELTETAPCMVKDCGKSDKIDIFLTQLCVQTIFVKIYEQPTPANNFPILLLAGINKILLHVTNGIYVCVVGKRICFAVGLRYKQVVASGIYHQLIMVVFRQRFLDLCTYARLISSMCIFSIQDPIKRNEVPRKRNTLQVM